MTFNIIFANKKTTYEFVILEQKLSPHCVFNWSLEEGPRRKTLEFSSDL